MDTIKVRKGKDGTRSATLGDYRLVSYPGKPPTGGGRSYAVNVPMIGFVLADEEGEIPVEVDKALCSALNIDYNPSAQCPACRRPYDPNKIRPPRVPVGIRCACCCQD